MVLTGCSFSRAWIIRIQSLKEGEGGFSGAGVKKVDPAECGIAYK
jgi:hypothetical protein